MKKIDTQLINKIYLGQKIDGDDIWGNTFINSDQVTEHILRESVAEIIYDDYLQEVSKHHSIEVMDAEVLNFLSKIPENGSVCDVGGCWGWHWRNIHQIRPDIQVFIVDFSRGSLSHARNFLKSKIGYSVHLIHGDATALEFESQSFDGYWTVQTLQHIPNLQKAIQEAHRVLKSGGVFYNYSLNNAYLMGILLKLIRKPYLVEGMVKNNFFLRRANSDEATILASIFNSEVTQKYSEILFQPQLKIHFSGREKSIFGKIDSKLSGTKRLLSLVARQRSFHTRKS